MFSKTTKFESLLEAVPDALVGMDTSGVIRFVNHQSELLFGHERDDLVGKHIETLAPEALWHVYLGTGMTTSRTLGVGLWGLIWS